MLEVSSFYVLFDILISQFCCWRNVDATNLPSVLFIPRLCPFQAAQSMNALNKWEGSHRLQRVTWLEQRVVSTVCVLEMESLEPGHGNGCLKRVMKKSNHYFPSASLSACMHVWNSTTRETSWFLLKWHKISTNRSSFITKEYNLLNNGSSSLKVKIYQYFRSRNLKSADLQLTYDVLWARLSL